MISRVWSFVFLIVVGLALGVAGTIGALLSQPL